MRIEPRITLVFNGDCDGDRPLWDPLGNQLRRRAGRIVGRVLFVDHLIVRSAIVPRAIGVALMIEGVAYWANSFVDFVAPGFAGPALQILMATGLAEVALCLWLLVIGINVQRWAELRALTERSARTPF